MGLLYQDKFGPKLCGVAGTGATIKFLNRSYLCSYILQYMPITVKFGMEEYTVAPHLHENFAKIGRKDGYSSHQT